MLGQSSREAEAAAVSMITRPTTLCHCLRRLQGADVDVNADDWSHRCCVGKGEASATAGLLITRRLVRRGSIDAADRLLGWLEASAREDVRVSVARARLYEWRRRDPRSALDVVEAAQSRMPEATCELDSRHARLERKIASYRFGRCVRSNLK